MRLLSGKPLFCFLLLFSYLCFFSFIIKSKVTLLIAKNQTNKKKTLCFYLKSNFHADLCLWYKNIFYTQSHEHKLSILNWQTSVYAIFGHFGDRLIEGRETFIPELDLLIPNYSGAHYLFSDSLAYQSTVEIKAAFIFLSLISSS